MMSKELEARKQELEILHKNALENIQAKNKGVYLETSEHIINGHYERLLKALTPPTEQEVCKELSEWFVDDDFYYDANQKEFYTKALNGQHSVVKMKKSEIHFGGWFIMPPHLITLIGRFYESEAHK